MESAEVELVSSSMRHLLENCSPADLPSQLIENGWDELLASDPAVAVGSLADAMGRRVRAAPLIDLVLQYGCGLGVDPTTAVVLPSMRTGTTMTSATVDGHEIVINGLLLAGHERAHRMLVVADNGVMVAKASSVRTAPLAPQDASMQLHSVVGRVPASDLVATREDWKSGTALGRRALAAELIGNASQMLEDTLAYITQRQQYGRSIGSFQSVKHRMADVHVATSAARAGLATAWSDGTAVSSMAAICLAARAQHLAATHCQQVHGGIAFTVEHGFHRFIRRGQLLAGLLGHPDDLVEAIGRQLVTDRQVPRTPQLD